MTAIVTLTDVRRSFTEAGRERPVLEGVDLSIEAGELVAIVGPSGSGKTSLLNVIGGLDAGFSGHAAVFGRTLEDLDDDARSRLRNELIGFVFQAFHLLEHLNVIENVRVPLWLGGHAAVTEAQEVERAQAALTEVGLGDRATASVTSLSGGERQRVAVARAMVHRPRLVLADEPTGNLDHDTGEEVFALFDALRKRDDGCAVVLVTHDEVIAARADRVLTLRDGRLTAASTLAAAS